MKPIANASDPGQIKEQEKRIKRGAERDKEDMLFVLADVRGRRVLWKILEHCKTFETIWRQSAEIHYLAGKQDVGHFLMAEIVETREKAFFEMMIEAKGEKDVR